MICTTHFSPPVISSTWKLSKSDGSSFCQKAHSELGLDTELDNSDPVADFSSKLYNIALTTIPKSKPHSKKHHTETYRDVGILPRGVLRPSSLALCF